ncbi:FAD-dependent oxidoreductase, partial [Nocardioides hankookensis]
QLSRLARTIGPLVPGVELKPLIEELQARAQDELDYDLEADAQRAFAAAFRDDPDVVVPDVVDVGPTTLVTEWLDSPASLAAVIADGSQAERDHYGELFVRFLFSGPARTGMLHADPHPGNYRVLADGRLGVLDFGAVARLPENGLPEAMGRLLRVAADEDQDELVEGLRREGFIKDRIKVDPEQLLAYLGPFVEPTKVERFQFSREWMRAQAARMNDPRDPVNLVGLKPTRGRISGHPMYGDPVGLATAGPITRTVADAAAMLDVLAGRRVGDPSWAPPPSESFLAASRRDPGRLRIGRFITPVITDTPVDAECQRAWEDASRLLESLGHEVEDVPVPLHSAEHFYVVTEPIEGVHPDLPIMRDPDGWTYFKEETGGLVVGGFEPEAKPWRSPDDLPYPFEFQLLPEDWEHFSVLMDEALLRIPALEETGIRKFYNGPESFTPDNQFLLGEAPGLRGFFVGAGFNSVGIASAGGAGRAEDVAEGTFDQVGAAVLAAGVDADDRRERGPLGPEAVDDGGQPSFAVVTDEQSSDGGNHDPEP